MGCRLVVAGQALRTQPDSPRRLKPYRLSADTRLEKLVAKYDLGLALSSRVVPMNRTDPPNPASEGVPREPLGSEVRFRRRLHASGGRQDGEPTLRIASPQPALQPAPSEKTPIERERARAAHPSVRRPAQTPSSNLDPAGIRPALGALRVDLGFETASLFVRTDGGWDLMERDGVVRPWHSVLDPAVLPQGEESAEYADVRTVPGAGSRLAQLGCESVAVLPLPDGARILLDSGQPWQGRAWIERARPYLHLLAVMSGPAWPAGNPVRGHGEVTVVQRVFSACQEIMATPGASQDHLLRAVRRALGAEELFVLFPGQADLEIESDPVHPWMPRLPMEGAPRPVTPYGMLAGRDLEALALRLPTTSGGLAGAFGRDDAVEIVVAGWEGEPALSPASMTVVARALSTARAALQARQGAVNSLMERERTKIAYALHDGLTQTVAGAVLELEAMQKQILRDPEGAVATLDVAKDEMRKALAELRTILFDLSNPGSEPSPDEPLTRYIEDVVRRWRLPARVAVEGDLGVVPSRVLSVAYVVIREGLANAAKHAAATNVTVRLVAGPTELVVIVGDSGPGFTPQEEEAAREAHHVGLDLLRRRVREAGGRLRVHSTPGRGTRVIARLPIREAAS